MSDIRLRIKNLYKIFGSKPSEMLRHVKNGISKKDLLANYNHILALSDVNIDIFDCGIQVVMGLSGSGKSTLIRHINRLIEPTSGEIIFDGQSVMRMKPKILRKFRQRNASMVFQKFALLPHCTVFENVSYGLKIQKLPNDVIKKRSQKWIDRVGLSYFKNDYPAQLSGGMQQRVGLARALATDTEILLMDEAFSALDPLTRADMQNMLLDLQEEFRKIIIFITHDIDEALHIGDSISVLRDGKVVQQGTPQEILLNPVDAYVHNFTKDVNRSRVLTVSSFIDDSIIAEGPKIDINMLIEDAISLLLASKTLKGVATENDKPIGCVSLENMMNAIVRPKSLTDNIQYC
jgi:glycine betaine/proline transport system ATP-binding protein